MGWNNNGRGWNNNNYNNYNDRGYGNNRGGYNNDRGYNNRDYDDRDRGYNNHGYESNLRLEEGTKCTLTYNPNKTVIIIRRGREQYECRDIDTLRIDWFYEHELEVVQE